MILCSFLFQKTVYNVNLDNITTHADLCDYLNPINIHTQTEFLKYSYIRK